MVDLWDAVASVGSYVFEVLDAAALCLSMVFWLLLTIIYLAVFDPSSHVEFQEEW